MAVNDKYEVVIKGRIEGSDTINVLHYNLVSDSVGTPTTALQVADAASLAFAAPLKAAATIAWSFVSVRAQRIRPLPLQVSAETFAGAGNGTIAGDNLPATVSLVLTKLTALAGRANRGRFYAPGIAELHSSGGLLNAAGVVAWDPVRLILDDSLITALGNGILAPIVYHRLTGLGEDILSARLNPILGNQRKRRIGVGA